MSSVVVVDVGNTRTKWGRCNGFGAAARVEAIARLPAEDAEAWVAQWQAWALARDSTWIVSGVHPGRRDALVAWLRERVSQVDVLTSHSQLPIAVHVDVPEKVGMDRLLNAVAANRRRHTEAAAVLVDAGTAVTVDYVDAGGAFRGGAIFPGLRLMAQALHDHTAMLPVVTIAEAVRPPGMSTKTAIQTGVFHTVLGGIERLIDEYQDQSTGPLELYLTGGDAGLLASRMRRPAQLWPEMTLEGILHSRPN